MIRAISILFSLIIIDNVYYLLSVYVMFAGLAIIIYLYKIKKFIIKSGYINYTAIFILTITYHYVYFFH